MASGIGRTMRIDYGDFTLSGKLTGLEMLAPTPCPAPPAGAGSTVDP